MRILILEDNNLRNKWFRKTLGGLGHGLVMTTTAEECKKAMMENDYFDIFFIDHDLGQEEMVNTSREDTGSGVCRWYVSNRARICKFKLAVTHSMNEPGRDNIASILDTIDLPCYKVPFTDLFSNPYRFMNAFEQSLD